MPSVQLNRLRSQINAVINHFEDSEEFAKSLRSLLQLYSDQKTRGRNWLSQEKALHELQVPHSVMVELDARLCLMARENPTSALKNADLLWSAEIYEMKTVAISLLSGLGSDYQGSIIERISQWINPELDFRLMKEILEAFENSPGILLNKGWVKSLSNWLSSSDEELRRLGLKALAHTIRMNYENLPQIFSLLTPVVQQPRISLQKELSEVIQTLIDRSEAETASFLIMAGTLYPEGEVRTFIRKCLPMFDPFFQSEIRNSLK